MPPVFVSCLDPLAVQGGGDGVREAFPVLDLVLGLVDGAAGGAPHIVDAGQGRSFT